MKEMKHLAVIDKKYIVIFIALSIIMALVNIGIRISYDLN